MTVILQNFKIFTKKITIKSITSLDRIFSQQNTISSSATNITNYKPKHEIMKMHTNTMYTDIILISNNRYYEMEVLISGIPI